MASARFSSASLFADLDPSISPATHCIHPAVLPPPGSVLSPIVPKPASDNPASARIASVTLSDCLTCSGCVTTSESLLLSTDVHAKLRSALEDPSTFTVVTLSQQSVASVGALFGWDLEESARRLCRALKDAGADRVVDGAVGMLMSLRESLEEMKQRGSVVLTSACPAVGIYVEKTQRTEVVEKLSRVKSVQGVMGRLVQEIFGEGVRKGKKLFHVAIMPCHDRKLEAARLQGEGVELVLTTEEIVEFFGKESLKERDGAEVVLDQLGEEDARKFGVGVASGSGGYAEFLLRELAGLSAVEKVEWKGVGRGALVKEAEAGGIKVAKAYGLRALARVLRSIKTNKCDYMYVEAMSCPEGCNNGGAQLKGKTREESRQLLGKAEELFAQGDVQRLQGHEVDDVYEQVVHGKAGSEKAKKLFYTDFKKRDAADSTKNGLSW